MRGRIPPASRFFTPAEETRLLTAIRAAEQRTSAEIRLHVENSSGGDVMARARLQFQRLGMERTAARNGVLFYLAVREHRFAVVGDEGVDRVVGAAFWNSLRDRLAESFQRGDFAAALAEAITATGDELKRFFPATAGDRNELPDTISE